ncbi:dihydrolipoyl dehydrogenase [Emcibacter sp.]|uniref:dihydrolipoyl dehydrogenase n=1 Tax=Emcibacter sp. TaxID=1979954 RepID=UPI003A8D34AF
MTAEMETYDVIVIGGGPAGYVAAIEASRKGFRTALVEAESLGGTCLNWGCIPTKALLRSAEVGHILENAAEFGFKIGEPKLDFKQMIARSRKVADQLSKGVQFLMKKAKVDLVSGFARLEGNKQISVVMNDGASRHLTAPHIILATGARARFPEGLEVDGKHIWSYREALSAKALPKSLLVIGAGAIGAEFASFYQSLGTKVTLVEMAERILPTEDPEISTFVEKQFARQGVSVKTGTSFELDKVSGDKVKGRLVAGDATEEIEAERVLVAIGVVGNTENIGLENTAAKLTGSFIRTSEWLETDEPGLYAIGDLVEAPRLAHKASHEALICVRKIAGDSHVRPMEKLYIPGCVYSHPQVASVGYTEPAALSAGRHIKVGRFPLSVNGKAIAIGETEGFVKVIFDADNNELLGAHMVGAEVTELIQGYVIALTVGAELDDLAHVIFPHPSLSEVMHEAVLDADDRAIHI